MTRLTKPPIRKIGLVVALLMVALLVLQVGVAFAHSHLKTANILPDSTITSVPPSLELTFTEDTDPDYTKVSVTDATGKQVDKGDLKVLGAVATVSLGTLVDGVYTVKFHTYTDDDGGVVEGSYNFTVALNGTPKSGNAGNSSENESFSAVQGGSVSIDVSGFAPQEKLYLWTTDPTGNALAASYIYADNDGGFNIRVDTADPKGLATTANYTTLIDSFDADGNDTQYWYLILKQPASNGVWHLTAKGSVSGTIGVVTFTVIPGK